MHVGSLSIHYRLTYIYIYIAIFCFSILSFFSLLLSRLLVVLGVLSLMYSELFDQVLVPSMSNSEVFLIKGDHQEGVEFDILKRPQMPEIQGESCVTTGAVAGSHDPELTRREPAEVEEDNDNDDQNKKNKKDGDSCKNTQVGSEQPHVKRLGLGEFNATTSDHDDEEGFTTPTSLDHKIPEIKQCPPAPKKPMPLPSKKRKSTASTSPNVRRSLPSDLSQEVESLFPRPIRDDLHRKIKKARTLEEDKENQ